MPTFRQLGRLFHAMELLLFFFLFVYPVIWIADRIRGIGSSKTNQGETDQ